MYFDNNINFNNNLDDSNKKRFNLKYIVIFVVIFLIIIVCYLIISNMNKYSLVLNGDTDIVIRQNSVYHEMGFEALDNKGNDVSKKVEIIGEVDSSVVGEYKIKYKLNNIVRERTVSVIKGETQLTYLILSGQTTMFLKVGDIYQEPGYMVIDSLENNLTSKVVISGSVNTNVAGTYKLIYAITNQSGYTITEERTIIVMDSNINISYSPTTVTSGEVTININVTDNYFDYLILPNNNRVTSRNASYKVSKNGTYRFVVYSKDGSYKQQEIIINNISKQSNTNSNITSVSIEKVNTGIKLGSSIKLKYSYSPSGESSSGISFKSSNERVAVVDNNGRVTGKGLGEAEISAVVNGKKLNNVLVKVIPNVDYIKVNKLSPKKYKVGFSFTNRNTKEAMVMQDFDIMNVGTSNEQYYFTMCYTGVTSLIKSPDVALKEKLMTTVIYKLNANQLGNTNQGRIMYIKNSGQGQWIVKEPTGNYFWTNDNGGLVCSGAGCSYSNGYVCSNVKECHWWGGNNANVQRVKFASNSYGANTVNDRTYNFGTLKQKRIAIYMALDSVNNLMVTINKSTIKKNYEVVVYKASDYKVGKKTIVYQFELVNNPKLETSVSIQGYALSGGYLYRLRGGYSTGIYIEVIDMYGNYILTQQIDPGYKKKRQEAQGLKIYNNRIYFGFTYRPDCIWDNAKNTCRADTMWKINNAIYYMG